MRTVLVLVLLVAAGGGWWWWNHQADQPAAAVAAEDGPFGGAPTTPTIGGGQNGISAATKAAIDAAEQAWAAAGNEPAQSPQAPALAIQFTAVLRQLYNRAGAWDEEERIVRNRLTPLGDALFFTKARFPDDPASPLGSHVVLSGENPDGISKRYGMSREFLNRLRGKDPNDSIVREGEALKIVNVKEKGFAIRIDKSAYYLDLAIAGIFARRYVISHGAADSPTPLGKTHLTDRAWHPQWTHPTTKKVYSFGDPENILGPIWLPFDAKELGQSSIGIHGYTGSDGKLGAKVSNGCVRMANDQGEELYRTISHPGRAPTAVEIVE